MRTSDNLEIGKVYTRQDLREKFKINDATIDTGIFRPKDHKSIWLFITQQKSKDMTQYNDRLEGDNLHVDGQSAGLKDKTLIGHEKNGDEILLFFRRTKTEHPGGGFRYEGRFQYVTHTGTRPAHFHFRRIKDSVVTRAFAYKTKSLSWVKTRLASRIRALVEMVDELLARIAIEPEDGEEGEATSYKLFADRNQIIAVCRECFAESELPEDMRRLSVVVDEILRQCRPKTSVDELRTLLLQEGFQNVRQAQSISLVDKIFIALYKANRITSDFHQGKLNGDKAYLITAEMTALCPALGAIPQERRITLSL